MNHRTLEQAFNAVFHDETLFNHFCSLNTEQEITSFEIGNRTVFKASEKLKSYLKFIDKVILRNLAHENGVVHSFIKGKSTLTAVKSHASSKYFFLTDIRNFYENIKTDDVYKILQRDRELLPITDIESYIPHLSKVMTLQDSVPVGFPTSPQLSNAFLYEFDKALNSFCIEKSLTYTRYADDIIISGNNFNETKLLLPRVQELLSNHASPKMILKESKTLLTKKGNKVKILGLIITPDGYVTIDSKYKKDIETLLYFFGTNKEKYFDHLNKKFKGDERSIFGLLHYANSVDPHYIEKLQKKYGAYTLRSLMEEKSNDR